MRLADQQESAPAPPRIVPDATCTMCGCMCDDIELTVEAGRITAAHRACALGEPWFLAPAADRPDCLIAGKPADVDAGIDQAAEILASAKYPLVWGLAHATCEAQQLAVGIADWIGGNVDTTTSILHGPSGVSFQGVGEVTWSLGEVANRGDLMIFWGTDPATSHPRHLSRYSLEPKGMFVPGGRTDRTCVVVDVQNTPTSARGGRVPAASSRARTSRPSGLCAPSPAASRSTPLVSNKKPACRWPPGKTWRIA